MKIEIKYFSGSQVFKNKDFLKKVLSLDEENMTPIMDACGYTEFPWEKRIAGLNRETTDFFAAYIGGIFVGYLEVGQDWKNADFLYLSSVQISKKYQGSKAFVNLIRSAFNLIKTKKYLGITSDVQVSNKKMIKIFNRFGFNLKNVGTHTLKVFIEFDGLLSNKSLRRIIGDKYE